MAATERGTRFQVLSWDKLHKPVTGRYGRAEGHMVIILTCLPITTLYSQLFGSHKIPAETEAQNFSFTETKNFKRALYVYPKTYMCILRREEVEMCHLVSQWICNFLGSSFGK